MPPCADLAIGMESSDRLEPEDEVNNLAADLLAQRRYERFVSALLTAPAGTWHRVEPLCAGVPLRAEERALFAGPAAQLHVAWLPAPAGSPHAAYRAIMFL